MQVPGKRFLNALAAGVLAGCTMLIAGGCQSVPPKEVAADWPVDADPVLKIQPGDILKVNFTYTPELNEEQAVRPDGMISLPLIGGVPASGKSPEELGAALTAQYSAQLKSPEINVVIKGLESHKVFVTGEVLKPGFVPMPGPLTALQAVTAAGGFNKRSAASGRVVILRQRGEKQYGRTIDLKEELESANSTPFQLQPFDIIFVPQTRIDQVDQWVDQYVNGIIPDNVGLGLNYTFFREVGNQNQTQRNINITP